ncbi:MAG TPA: hypothetical protein VE154_03655 [Chthoniobacterales bacterium]|nr:hypothetical protein [Chthoniobacterales bacterium]
MIRSARIYTKNAANRQPKIKPRQSLSHTPVCAGSDESAEELRAYMSENPVRAGFVQRACDWPYGGEVFKPGF